jgi:hypothetical protein
MHLSTKKGIAGSIIAVVVVIMIASGLYVFKSSQKTIKYAGRVVDSNTNKAIPGAKVSIEMQGVPQVYYTDSDGIFYLEIPAQMETPRVRVEAADYKVFDRNVSIIRTGLEDIRLTRIANDSTPITPQVNSNRTSNADTATAEGNTKTRTSPKKNPQKNSPYNALNYNGQ